jgi:hypothetical protein
MEEFLRSPGGAIVLGVVGVAFCVTLLAVGCTVAVQWRKVRQAKLEADLKREMLQQGMSVDQIVKVLGASATASAAGLEADLIRELVYQGMSAEEIVKVLGAAASPNRSPGETRLTAAADQQARTA